MNLKQTSFFHNTDESAAVSTFIESETVELKRKFTDTINETSINRHKSLDAAKLVYERCLANGYLSDFLKRHKAEVISMFESLFDEKLIQEAHDNEIREEALEKGIAEGINKGKAEVVQRLLSEKVPLEQALPIVGMSNEEYFKCIDSNTP